ncbi:MAG: glycosyltransferase family 4 protein [Armatimonadetes bacterium]|nr:glycosyltransferase family 4 protein [Armatimonadota bacterium]
MLLWFLPLFLLLIWVSALRGYWCNAPHQQLILCGRTDAFSRLDLEVLTRVVGCEPPIRAHPWLPPLSYLLHWRALRSSHLFLGTVPWWTVFLARDRVCVLWSGEHPGLWHRAGSVLCRTWTELLAVRRLVRLHRCDSRCQLVGFTSVAEQEPAYPSPIAGRSEISVLYLGDPQGALAIAQLWASDPGLPPLVLTGRAGGNGSPTPNVLVEETELSQLLARHPLHLCDGSAPSFDHIVSLSRYYGALQLDAEPLDRLSGAIREALTLTPEERARLGLENQDRFHQAHQSFRNHFPMGRPEVFFFTGGVPPRTGGQLYDHQMIKELRRRRIGVDLFDLLNFRHLTGAMSAGWFKDVPYAFLLALFLSTRYQLFIVNQAYAHWLAVALSLRALLRRGKSIVIVHHLEHYDSARSGRRIRWLHRAQLGAADLVITVSEYCKRELLSLGIPESRIRVVSGGVHPERLPEAIDRPVPAGPIRLLFVGQCVPRKGLPALIEALARVERRAFHLHLVGNNETDHCRHELVPLIQELGLAEEVTVEGHVGQARLRELYATCDAFVFPSIQEGYGLALLEAMYSGLPVLCSRATALPELVEEERSGYLFEPGDPADIARVLRRALAEPEALPRMGRAAHQKALSQSTWQESRARFFEAVAPLLG